MKYSKILYLFSIACIVDAKPSKELFNQRMNEISAYDMSELSKFETEEGCKKYLSQEGQEKALKLYCAYKIRKSDFIVRSYRQFSDEENRSLCNLYEEKSYS
ncbi:hypothetical protein FZC35_01335 [Candidatus Cytomitobacter indipagum]|uniref:Uncharacterized protein n=1 Tax=Candidatus Cytomitobacter indipagum TaxID=2601575 RepID=A0A5C0UDF6_9PROT|nr:hypothetical protein [Candidatus Cytomitobacter indipagum]QEK38018.1 hypothetical protein FZC35_01335 [Candidatus Cytomitobacter indipagum]